MERLASETGGRVINVGNNGKKLQEAFDQIQDELRTQYLASYTPTNLKIDGTFRPLNITCQPGQKIQARKGYYAMADALGNDNSAITQVLSPRHSERHAFTRRHPERERMETPVFLCPCLCRCLFFLVVILRRTGVPGERFCSLGWEGGGPAFVVAVAFGIQRALIPAPAA